MSGTTTRFATRLAVVAVVFGARVLCAQLPEVRTAAMFDRGDRRARELLTTLSCSQQISRARRAGNFGALDSLGRIGNCIRVHGRATGVFFDADSAYAVVRNLSVVDLGTGARATDGIDTSLLLSLARAEAQAHARGGEKFFTEHRPYGALTFRGDGDSTEVRLVPVGLLMGAPITAGGERGFLFTPDGRTLVRETDASALFRTIAIPDTGVVHIASGEAEVPSLSEFVLANRLNEAGRDISIDMQGSQAMLTGRGSRAVWVRMMKHRGSSCTRRVMCVARRDDQPTWRHPATYSRSFHRTRRPRAIARSEM